MLLRREDYWLQLMLLRNRNTCNCAELFPSLAYKIIVLFIALLPIILKLLSCFIPKLQKPVFVWLWLFLDRRTVTCHSCKISKLLSRDNFGTILHLTNNISYILFRQSKHSITLLLSHLLNRAFSWSLYRIAFSIILIQQFHHRLIRYIHNCRRGNDVLQLKFLHFSFL